jgi:hypothetical protein
VTEPLEVLRQGGKLALESSDGLYNMADELLTPDDPGDEALRVVRYLQESAHEIRRHALWLLAEAEKRDWEREILPGD